MPKRNRHFWQQRKEVVEETPAFIEKEKRKMILFFLILPNNQKYAGLEKNC